MAYFPNGSSNSFWRESNCDVCRNWSDEVGCPIETVHLLFNSDQIDESQKKLREALNILIGTTSDGLYAEPCSMFAKRTPPEVDANA